MRLPALQHPSPLETAAALPRVPGSPRLGVLRRLRPVPDRSAVGAPSPAGAAGCGARGRGPGRFPCSLWFARRSRSPTMPLRHRCEYAADLPRSLPGGSCPPPRKFPAHELDGCAPLPAQINRVSSWRRIKRVSHVGSSRTPLRPACRTRPIRSYWTVPSLSGLLPPSPAPPGSGCPQLHRPAATGSAAEVSHLHSNHSASRRTHDLRHTAATLLRGQGVDIRVVQAILGHSTLAVTKKYMHVTSRLAKGPRSG